MELVILVSLQWLSTKVIHLLTVCYWYKLVQVHGCWPCNYVTVVEFQPDVCHASATSARHADRVTVWHLSSHSRISDTERVASMVRNVFGSRSRASWLLTAMWQAAWVLRRWVRWHADGRWPVRHRRRRLLPPRQNQLPPRSTARIPSTPGWHTLPAAQPITQHDTYQ